MKKGYCKNSYYPHLSNHSENNYFEVVTQIP